MTNVVWNLAPKELRELKSLSLEGNNSVKIVSSSFRKVVYSKQK